ncbi:hypothetical protein K5X82_08985 [Halosquirtibacter xylanolyticus]|uniref:clostripain-related cysteine peptidase n=1 Tax=Halosquirtibacter xylanolyticus TaxID=3374599 RepID=UPI003748840C|nr:hypothetical protein K5X82_08985 [Prolixibacteraceae bacterium]
MKKLSTFLILLLISPLLFSCQQEDHEASIKLKEAIIVYMCADNNLKEVADLNIEDMVEGIDPDADVFVYLDQGEKNSYIYKLVPDNLDATRGNPVATFENLDSGCESTVAKIIDHVLTHYPSETIGLVLWSHGSGWMAPAPSYTNKSFGDDNGNDMSIKDLTVALKSVLSRHNKTLYEYILFDACLMGDIEVISELKDICNYIAASTDLILEDGYPYNQFMKAITNKNDDLETRLVKACETYIHYYINQEKTSKQFGTLSLYKTSEVDRLIQTMNHIISTSYMNYNNLFYNGEIEFFNHTPFKDFMKTVEAHFTEAECTKLKQSISQMVIYTKNVDILLGRSKAEDHCGISMFIPYHYFYYDLEYYTTGVWAEQSRYGVILRNSINHNIN